MIQMKLKGVRDVVQEEVKSPVPQEGEAIVKVHSVGICGSDIHIYTGENPGIRPENHVCGHEFSGTIKHLSSNLDNWQVGDKVCVNPVVTCGECYYCRNQMEHLCAERKVIGGEIDGAMCEEVAVPIPNMIKVPDGFDIANSAMIEPVAVAVHSSNRIHDSNVVVLGLGTIGLLTVQVCKLNKNRVVAADISDAHFDLARQFGVDDVFLFKGSASQAMTESRFGSSFVDVIVDNVNQEATVDFSIGAVRRKGQIIAVGIPHRNFQINMIKLLVNEIGISTSYLYTRADFQRAARLVFSGKIDVTSLITRRFKMTETKAAFEYKLKSDAIKVLIDI